MARSALDRRYDGNTSSTRCAVGVAAKDAFCPRCKASGVGDPIVYLGSKTGRDGIHGASMASAAFDADAWEKCRTVQVGDPFAEKLLLEACLKRMASPGAVVIGGHGLGGAHFVGGLDGGEGRSLQHAATLQSARPAIRPAPLTRRPRPASQLACGFVGGWLEFCPQGLIARSCLSTTTDGTATAP